MSLSLRRGTVSAVRTQNDELIRLDVDGAPCLAYPRLTGPVEVGDDVVVNVQARELGLGSGGFDVLYLNLTRGLDAAAATDAHVMTLPYTPLQSAVRHVEEDGELPASIDGMPVVCCSLHSQVAPVCAGLRRRNLKIAYAQIGGGALPVSLSDALRALKADGLLLVAVAVSPCLDGDVQAVTIASALAWVKGHGYDVAVCSIGPGIVGTASALGHGGLAAAEAANTAAALGGVPILAVRYSDADPRERHQGVSHHTRTILELCPDATVAWPRGLDAPEWLSSREEVDVEGWHEDCARLPLSHMGRGMDEDPCFFMVAFAAGRYACSLVAL
ncbi:MAG: DUF3866 family protein [Gaiellales bacterium]